MLSEQKSFLAYIRYVNFPGGRGTAVTFQQSISRGKTPFYIRSMEVARSGPYTFSVPISWAYFSEGFIYSVGSTYFRMEICIKRVWVYTELFERKIASEIEPHS